MEVHAHSHTPRRKWTHYFWEFLMLFLAVFCGFLAEYTLEHKIEKNRERQYIKSMAEDLETDTLSLQTRIGNCELTIRRVDSLIALLNQAGDDQAAGDIYYFLRGIHRSDFFMVNDRTIIQLRHAGAMRLISRKIISDSIISYYSMVDYIAQVYDEQLQFRRSLRPLLHELLDGNDFGKVINERNIVVRPVLPLKLRISNPNVINNIILILQNIKGINISLGYALHLLREKAKNTRNTILREYHLK